MTERSWDKPDNEYLRTVKSNLARVLSAVNGRATVMAATKTVSPEVINYAISCGLTDIGENRVQELTAKYDALHLENTNLHFIGTLQPNKVKYLIGRVSLIHSLDSMKLATEIARRSEGKGLITDTLCEINIGNEAAKGGIPEEEAAAFIRSVSGMAGIRVRGLMVIGPHSDTLDGYRPFFERTRKLYDRLSAEGLFGEAPILSMGMSDNYALAVEYGATIVRPGTAIFGSRAPIVAG